MLMPTQHVNMQKITNDKVDIPFLLNKAVQCMDEEDYPHKKKHLDIHDGTLYLLH